MRPPPDDDDGGPDVVTFGIAAVDGRLEATDVTFPATADELERHLGDAEIPYDASGNGVAFRTVLDRIDAEQFDTRQELLNALHPVFEERRTAASSGLLGQLRSLLPI